MSPGSQAHRAHTLTTQWTITVTEGDNYTIKNSTVADNFLAPGLVDQVANGTALIGKPAQATQPPRNFTAREVPGTGLYKCEVS